jgi:hypothetical protein
MKKKYNNISLALGLPGLLLQSIGTIGNSESAAPLALIGSIMFIIGLAYYAMAKGRSPLWAVMGFLSIIGLIILALLPDHTLQMD